MKFSKNFLSQMLSLVFLALTFSGLDVVPDELANKIVGDLSGNLSFSQILSLVFYLGTNYTNVFVHWYQQWKEDKTKLWTFVKSINFWIAVANIITGHLLLNWGIEIPEEAVTNFLELLFNAEYWNAASVFIIQILFPVIKAVVNKKQKENDAVVVELKNELAALRVG